MRLLDAAETARRTGSSQFHGALFDARAGTIQPLAYVRGLARAAVAARATLHERSAATGTHHDGSCWKVATARGVVAAPVLIQATDSYEHRGGQPPIYTPVHYFQYATAPLSDNLRRSILPGGEGCWDTATVMSSFRLDAAGRMLVGGVGNLDGMGGVIHSGWAARKLARLFPSSLTSPSSMAGADASA